MAQNTVQHESQAFIISWCRVEPISAQTWIKLGFISDLFHEFMCRKNILPQHIICYWIQGATFCHMSNMSNSNFFYSLRKQNALCFIWTFSDVWSYLPSSGQAPAPAGLSWALFPIPPTHPSGKVLAYWDQYLLFCKAQPKPPAKGDRVKLPETLPKQSRQHACRDPLDCCQTTQRQLKDSI